MYEKKKFEVAAFPPLPETHVTLGGPRRISYDILKNRGFSRYRKKSLKNPRKRAIERFKKTMIRKKGQVI
jgi:U3 small nucleolar RNA-associated protein 3